LRTRATAQKNNCNKEKRQHETASNINAVARQTCIIILSNRAACTPHLSLTTVSNRAICSPSWITRQASYSCVENRTGLWLVSIHPPLPTCSASISKANSFLKPPSACRTIGCSCVSICETTEPLFGSFSVQRARHLRAVAQKIGVSHDLSQRHGRDGSGVGRQGGARRPHGLKLGKHGFNLEILEKRPVAHHVVA